MGPAQSTYHGTIDIAGNRLVTVNGSSLEFWTDVHRLNSSNRGTFDWGPDRGRQRVITLSSSILSHHYDRDRQRVTKTMYLFAFNVLYKLDSKKGWELTGNDIEKSLAALFDIGKIIARSQGCARVDQAGGYNDEL